MFRLKGYGGIALFLDIFSSIDLLKTFYIEITTIS